MVMPGSSTMRIVKRCAGGRASVSAKAGLRQLGPGCAILGGMTEPKLTVIGVYRPLISEETWREQWQVTEDGNATREHFDGLA